MEDGGEPANRRDPLSFHKCQLCAFRTNSVHVLLSHFENHKLKSEFGLFLCKSADLEVYKCKFCYFESDLKIAACRHESLVHGTKRCSDPEMKLRSYICDKCSFETYSVIVFARHFCDDCQLEESMKTTLLEIWRHCGMCSYKTKSKGNLKRHISMKHANPREIKWFECEHCSFITTDQRNLSVHFKNIHSKKWFECGQCSYKTKDEGSDEGHMKTHISKKHLKRNEMRWLKCEQCCYKTKFQGFLDRHILKKHDMKPQGIKGFECEQCSYKAKRRDHLKTHILLKHLNPYEIKWFECEHCSHKTKTKYQLKSHILRKHTKPDEIKWAECEHCSFKTKTRTYLKKHILKLHPKSS